MLELSKDNFLDFLIKRRWHGTDVCFTDFCRDYGPHECYRCAIGQIFSDNQAP